MKEAYNKETMEKKIYGAKSALPFLKGGYTLLSLIEEEVSSFTFEEDKVVIKSESKTLILNEYQFVEIYSDTLFEREEEEDQEEVDPKKDEEYYSWRQ